MQLLLDETNVQKLLEDYHALLGVGIGLYDKYYQPISLIPKRGWNFCNIIRTNKKVAKACHQCDMTAFKHVEKTKELYIYRCHMGLYEAVAPIIDNDMIIGFIMVGQLLDEHSINHQYLITSKKCRAYALNEDAYKKAFYELTQMNRSKIEAAANIMHACSAYLCFKNIVRVERSGLFPQIDLYLRDNLKYKITPDAITSRLKISKTTLYTIMMDNVAMSLTMYLRKLRMDLALELLTTSDLTIKAIAEEVGIDDYNYFSRLFKKTYGQSPRSYRQKFLKN